MSKYSKFESLYFYRCGIYGCGLFYVDSSDILGCVNCELTSDLASSFWIDTERINSGKVDIKSSESTKKDKLDKSIKVDPKIYNSSSIGSDEVGTGDYFGPIVVTAAYVSKENIPYLEELGVKDSKQMLDDKILEVVPKIIKKIPYESMILTNTEYNNKYSKDLNLNKIKAILHNNVLYKLRESTQVYDYIIVDEFAKDFIYYNYLRDNPNVVKNITFLTKGETKSLAVDYVDDIAYSIAKEKGMDYLKDIAKLNFKNTKKVEERLR